MKNKTIAAWITFVGGPLGLHRFYLFGLNDTLGWLLPIPTALGLYGIERVQENGLDDMASWWLIPLLGFTIAACALNAIVYALKTPEVWNSQFNPQAQAQDPAGKWRVGLLRQNCKSIKTSGSIIKNFHSVLLMPMLRNNTKWF